MWASFMKTATSGDDGTWFEPPRDVVAVEVCRRSGDLPGPGCRNAASRSPNGEVTYKSTVYTDYFVRGREPQRTCAAHADEYLPYPEPYFAVGAFDGLPPLEGFERVMPDPVPVAVTTIPAQEPVRAPASQRRLVELPVAVPDARPEAPSVPMGEPGDTALPPPALPEPAPPEPPPAGP
jgi:hypothetical protein